VASISRTRYFIRRASSRIAEGIEGLIFRPLGRPKDSVFEECNILALKYDGHPSSSRVEVNSELAKVVCQFDGRNNMT